MNSQPTTNSFRGVAASAARQHGMYQRMELFIVPVLQWLACLMIGSALLVDAGRRRFQRPGDESVK